MRRAPRTRGRISPALRGMVAGQRRSKFCMGSCIDSGGGRPRQFVVLSHSIDFLGVCLCAHVSSVLVVEFLLTFTGLSTPKPLPIASPPPTVQHLMRPRRRWTPPSCFVIASFFRYIAEMSRRFMRKPCDSNEAQCLRFRFDRLQIESPYERGEEKNPPFSL